MCGIIPTRWETSQIVWISSRIGYRKQPDGEGRCRICPRLKSEWSFDRNGRRRIYPCSGRGHGGDRDPSATQRRHSPSAVPACGTQINTMPPFLTTNSGQSGPPSPERKQCPSRSPVTLDRLQASRNSPGSDFTRCCCLSMGSKATDTDVGGVSSGGGRDSWSPATRTTRVQLQPVTGKTLARANINP